SRNATANEVLAQVPQKYAAWKAKSLKTHPLKKSLLQISEL
ncbi:MAG: 4-(cytidine 5'-diphospho)-2-C-methyl-D-erythritol kinase, partial [Oxalobacteraceae bacterium]